jgi:type IV pilus biogenesis protein CpaD/CtpE
MDTPLIYRAQSPVAILLDPQTDIPLGEGDIRLEDYLNDKIQTRADLANLASLMKNIELQKKQLEEQVGFYHCWADPGLCWLTTPIAR